jgi:hypothetical protein
VRRTTGVLLPLLFVLLAAGCTTTVVGIASPGATETRDGGAPAADPALPGGAQHSCLIGDGCDSQDEDTGGGQPALVACSSLPAAVASFDASAGAVFPGWQAGGGTPEQEGALGGVVAAVVDRCGFQVMVDVANQYPEPLYSALLDIAMLALGDLYLEPDSLHCADLEWRGYGAKDAVDYWFLWGAPPLMDADADGIPCETVFPDVERYLPDYW